MQDDPSFDECPVYRTAEVLEGKWTMHILRSLLKGPIRFNQIRTTVGRVSPKALTERLGFLASVGIVKRIAYAEIPPRVEYELTEKGKALAPIFEEMRCYGDRWLPR